MNRDELEGKGLFQGREATGDRIQQLQQQIEAWEALLEELGGNE
ncbi:MAG: hypothetical protein AB1589_40450 [Cyanobacteriota bacterium]